MFIHYGSKKFDRTLFRPIKNIPRRNKPSGGLWASPTDAHFGWKQWNEEEQYAICDEKNSFRFTLSETARVYWIRTEKDVREIATNRDENMNCLELLMGEIEFEFLSQHYDAICFEINQETYYALLGWDCDSILVMNPDIVQEVKEVAYA